MEQGAHRATQRQRRQQSKIYKDFHTIVLIEFGSAPLGMQRRKNSKDEDEDDGTDLQSFLQTGSPTKDRRPTQPRESNDEAIVAPKDDLVMHAWRLTNDLHG